MKIRSRIFSILILIAITAQAFFPAAVKSAGTYIIPVPGSFDVKITDGLYDIIYDKMDFKHKATLKWTQAGDPANLPDDIDEYGSIVQKGYQVYTSTDNVNFHLFPVDIPWGAGTGQEISVTIDSDGASPLKPGTIYYTRVKAFHRHVDANQVETVHESLYATALFMTTIDVKVIPRGTDRMEIAWDDVKYNGVRIDYDIDVSQSKDFATYQTYPVRSHNISSAGPVTPVAGQAGETDKLRFVINSADFGIRPGTVYYVRVKPKNMIEQIRHRPESYTAVGYTNIVATMTRMSQDWWRIDWNPVTESSLGSGQTVQYSIKRGSLTQPNLPPVTIASKISDRKYPVNVTGDNYYYIVVAEVKDQFGNDIPDGIQSDRLTAVETLVPSKPAVPDLRDEIRKFYPDGELIFNYPAPENLTPRSVSVAWTTPRNASGEGDTDILYDIWLLTNPADLINNNAPKLRSDYRITADHASQYIEIVAGDKAISKFTFTDLNPNTTYYLKLVAKKYYIVNEGGSLVTKAVESDPALKVIITPTGGPIDQPAAPARPPLRIKAAADGKEDVDGNSVRVQWTNEWDEHWDSQSQKWIYTEDDYVAGDVYYRHVEYDSGTTFRIGYVPYQDGMDYQTVQGLPVQPQIIPNDTARVIQEYNLTGLQPNTTYVVWLRAVREGIQPQVSESSDPIIVVTKPQVTEPVEKPTVPKIYYSLGKDTYVDLQWNYHPDYTYYIKYSTTDNVQTAQETLTVTPAQLLESTVYRITGLSQNTVYYFWIQADSTGQNAEEGLSLWSDSHVVKTSPYTPPDVPLGFGVKNTADAVQKNSVTFEWLMEDGLEYTLELSMDVGFVEFTEYSAGAAGEYKADNLRSNVRYYARLYAYDPAKELRSLRTQVIMAKTLQSGDDYDSDVDTDNVLTGPFVTETSVNGVWTFKVTGANADRFIEQMKNDSVLDYRFDLSKPPANTREKVVVISNSVFGALSSLKENVIIDLGYVQCTLRPGLFDTDQIRKLQRENGKFDIEIRTADEDRIGNSPQTGLKYKTKTVNVLLNAVQAVGSVPIKQLNRPLRLSFLYADSGFFKNDLVEGYTYDSISGKWIGHPIQTEYDYALAKGYAYFDAQSPGRAALMTKTGDYTDIFDEEARSQIMSIAAKFDLKSVNPSGFRPQDNITREEAVKMMLDVIGYDYGSDYAVVAAKAGFIAASSVEYMDGPCSGRELKQMVDRLQKRLAGDDASGRYFTIDDDSPITRANAMVELYTMLKDIGEI